MAKYISAADTAKLVRAELKKAFPSTTFRVLTRHGSSIDIEWTDGPTYKEVNEIAQQFNGAHFDGMIDLESPVTHIVNGEEISYGSKYVSCQRHYSREFQQHMVDYVMATHHFDIDPEFSVSEGIITKKFTIAPHIIQGNTLARFGNEWASDFVVRLMRDIAGDKLPAIPVKEAQAEAEAVPAVDYDALGMSIIADVVADLNAWDDEIYGGAGDDDREEYEAAARYEDEKPEPYVNFSHPVWEPGYLESIQDENADLFEQVASLPVPEETQQALERLATHQPAAPVIGWNGEAEDIHAEGPTIASYNGWDYHISLDWIGDYRYDLILCRDGVRVSETKYLYADSAKDGFKVLIEREEKRLGGKRLKQEIFTGKIAALNVDSLSPIEALTMLYQLKREAAQLG